MKTETSEGMQRVMLEVKMSLTAAGIVAVPKNILAVGFGIATSGHFNDRVWL